MTVSLAALPELTREVKLSSAWVLSPVRATPYVRELLAVEPRYPADPAWPPYIATQENDMVQAVNEFRKKNGRAPLVVNPTIQPVGHWKARNMAAWLYMMHDDPANMGWHSFPGRVWFDRWADLSFDTTHAAFGENIAYGTPDVEATVYAFTQDEAHLQNMISAAWSSCAMGVAAIPGGTIAGDGSDLGGALFWWQGFSSQVTAPTPDPTPAAHPVHGETWRKKAAHKFEVVIDRIDMGTPKYVHGHHPGGPPIVPGWRLATFMHNFERKP